MQITIMMMMMLMMIITLMMMMLMMMIITFVDGDDNYDADGQVEVKLNVH